MTTLTRAHVEWSKRAADERFSSVADLHAKATQMRDVAKIAPSVPVKLMTAIDDNGAVRIVGPKGTPASVSHWAFGQIARYADAPANYLRSLPASLAADCLNNGLRDSDDKATLLLTQSGNDLDIRAATSDRYSRVWNCDITSRLLDIEADGIWQPAPAAFDGSRGLYLGNQDMFAFMVDSDRRIFETLPGGGLSRGFFVWNSEVGAASVGVTTFLYEYVCGNHRVWGASNVKEVRLRHVGASLDARTFGQLQADLIEYANASADEDEARIERMRTIEIGSNKTEILDSLFNRFKLAKKTAIAAIDLAVEREDWYGNPRSVWGIAGAITEIARDKPNASERDELNRVGAKVMTSF